MNLFLAVLGLVGALLLSLFGSILWLVGGARFLKYLVKFDDDVWVSTEDGARVRLSRVLPKGAKSPLPPVVLAHGLAMNRRTFALDPKEALAWRLAEEGRDVWLIELRGATRSGRGGSLRHNSFDTYARYDVPAALAHIQKETGAAEVDWVGFSMGGLLAYAHLGALGGKGIRRLVTIGSPVGWAAYQRSRLRHTAGIAKLLLAVVHFTPYRWLLTAIAPLVGTWVPPLLTPSFRGERYDGVWLRRMMANCFGDAPSGVTRQFLAWISFGTWTSEDGKTDYMAGLSKVTVPLCVIAGDRDRLALPEAVMAAVKATGSTETRSFTIGTETGAAGHYDHLDLIAARDAGRDVFPKVLAWIGG